MFFNMLRRPLVLACLLCLSLAALTGCGKTKTPASLSDFQAACEQDGLTASAAVTDAKSKAAEYSAYEHGTEGVLAEYYRFSDENAAKEQYLALGEEAEQGPSATTYEMTGSNYSSVTITADRAYTVITQVEDTLVRVTGPVQFKSVLDRILLSIGYLTSNL